MNGLFAAYDELLVVFVLYDDGIKGGGRLDPLVKVGVLETVNCSRVGALFVLTNGFGVRVVVDPKGFVAELTKKCV